MSKSEESILKEALSSQDLTRINKVYEEIYYSYVKLVAFCIGKYTSNVEDIKDLTNEVFLRFFKNADKVDNSIKYYLLNIARNITYDYLKKYNNVQQLDDKFLNTGTTDSYAGYLDLIEDLNKVLNEREVKIIVLKAIDGYTFNEISEKLNLSLKNAISIYHRALKKYRKARE